MSLYEELPTPHSIRVLSLAKKATEVDGISADSKTGPQDGLPDPRTHPIVCEMSVISLAGPETFDALSYVWGDPSVKEGSMICNHHQIDITFNLWSALQQLWRNWPDKKLWVDAICINQEDIPERNHQVMVMGTIYNRAEHVLVWLGQSIQKSHRLFQVLNNLSRGPPPAETTTELVNDSQPASKADSVDLTEILSRPWFYRAWTLQEIKLARKAIICCGSAFDDYSSLSRAIDEYNDSQAMAKICGLGFVGNPIPEVPDNATLFYLLTSTSGRKASDPRDKLYSLLSLLPKDLYDFMEVDYSLSEEETIIWVSRIFIEFDDDTACLFDAGLANRANDSLPSWEIDWRNRDQYESSGRRNLPEHLRTDTKLLRARFNYGRELDRTNKKLKNRGWGLGRLQVNEEGSLAFLTVFPNCALQTAGARSGTPGACYGLSTKRFFDFCKKIKQHDEEKCNCMNNSSRTIYPGENLPGQTKDGDWLWRPANDLNETVTYDVQDESSRVGDESGDASQSLRIVPGLMSSKMNDCHDFILRPIQGISEVDFQLVGRAWGAGIRGVVSRFSVSFIHPGTIVIASTFVLV